MKVLVKLFLYAMAEGEEVFASSHFSILGLEAAVLGASPQKGMVICSGHDCFCIVDKVYLNCGEVDDYYKDVDFDDVPGVVVKLVPGNKKTAEAFEELQKNPRTFQADYVTNQSIWFGQR